MNIKKTLHIYLFILLCSCSENNILLEPKTPALKFKYKLTIPKNNSFVSFNFGIWMFKANYINKNAIANWINVEHLGKKVLEPINVVWVDFRAKNKEESTENIISFLTQNNFLMRSGSSIGYSSFFEDYQWVGQYQETWSNKLDPNTINNHGRIFLSHQIKTESNGSFFVSSGAFSVESEKHLFISFKEALQQFNAVKGWSLYKDKLNVGNSIVFDNYSTFDHEGIKVFILK